MCPVCCATKRLTEIACPPDCGYLSAARAHPAAVVQRQQDRDLAYLLPKIADLSETQYQLFMFLQAIVLQRAAAMMPAPLDADVADAAGTVAATLETANKGIIYEHQAASLPAQRLAAELRRGVADLAERAGSSASRLERDSAAALRRLERAARDAQKEAPDAASPVSSWMTLSARLLKAAGPARAATPSEDQPGTLVL